jgi:hypothetical protein
MLLANDRELVADPTWLASHYSDDFGPQWRGSGEELAASEDVETMLSPRQGDTHAIVDLEKSNVAMFVVSHERQNDDTVFFTLIRVNGNDIDVVVRH